MSVSPALVLSLPLAAAAVLTALLDRIPRRIAEWFAIAIAIVTLAGTIDVLVAVLRGGTIAVWMGGWHPGNRVGLGIVLAIDPAAACVAVLVATVVLAAIVFSYQYFEEAGTIFYVLILAMLGSMVAFAYAGDIFNMFVWYEVFSVAAYALSTFHGATKNAFEGALQFALTNTVAGLFFLTGIIMLEGRTGELDLVAVGHSLAAHGRPDVLVTTSLACVAIGLFTRGALAPLQFWFDEVHTTAPTPLSAILSGAMTPLALYGFVRVYWSIYAGVLPPSHALVAALEAIAIATALYGTLMTMRESHFKRKLAHAGVAHAGVALAAIGAFTVRGLAGAAIYATSYALAAAALFFATAILKSIAGERDVRLLQGSGHNLPLTGIAFAVAATMLTAVWSGARAVGDTGSTGTSMLVTVLEIVVAAGTGGAFLAAFVRVFVYAPRVENGRRPGEAVPWFLISPAIALATAATALVIAPRILDFAAACSADLMSREAYGRAVMAGVRAAAPAARRPVASLATLAGPALALAVAFAILTRARTIRRFRVLAMKNVAYRFFDAIDNGDSGAYIAWIAGTAAALSLVFSFAL